MNVEIKITLGHQQAAGLLTLLGREAASLGAQNSQQSAAVAQARDVLRQQAADQRDAAFEMAMGYESNEPPSPEAAAAVSVPGNILDFQGLLGMMRGTPVSPAAAAVLRQRGSMDDYLVSPEEAARQRVPGRAIEDFLRTGSPLADVLGMIPLSPEQRIQLQACQRGAQSNPILSAVLALICEPRPAAPHGFPVNSPPPQVDLTPEAPPSSMPIPPPPPAPPLAL